MDDSIDTEFDDLLCELGHLAWLVKYSLRCEPSISYGFLDGLLSSVMCSSGCSHEHMEAVAVALHKAFDALHEEGIDDNDAYAARRMAQ